MRYLLLVTILLPAFGAVVVSAWSRHVRRLRVCALASSWSCVVCAIVLSVHHQTTFTGRRSNPADQYQYRSAVVLVSGSVTEEAGRAARAAVIRVALAVNEIRLLLIVSTALLTSAVLHCLAGRDGPHNPAVVMLVLVTESFVLVALAAFDIVLYAVAVGCVGMCLSAATGLGCPHRAGKAESQFHAGIVSTTVLLTVGSVILVVGCAWVNAAYSGAQAAPGFALHQLHIAADRAIRSGGPLLNVWYWASAWAFLCFAGAFLVQAGAFPIHAWRRQLAWGLDEPLLALCLASTARLGLFGLIWIIVPLFPLMCVRLSAAASVVGVVTVAVAGLTLLDIRSPDHRRQSDTGMFISMFSMSAVGTALLGVASLRPSGLNGAVILLVAHDLVLAAVLLRRHRRIRSGYVGIPAFIALVPSELLIVFATFHGPPTEGSHPLRPLLTLLLLAAQLVVVAGVLKRCMTRPRNHIATAGSDHVDGIERTTRGTVVPGILIAACLLWIGLRPDDAVRFMAPTLDRVLRLYPKPGDPG